jgi:hypothetical protein
MTTLEKLQQVAELLESAYYDLEDCQNIHLHLLRGLSVAEDLVADAINHIKAKG